MELWIVVLLTFLLVIWVGVSLGTGAMVLRHPDWDVRFRHLAEEVIRDRPIALGDLTQSDLEVAAAVLGAKVAHTFAVDSEASVRAAQRLAGKTDPNEAAQLLAESERRLEQALDSQRRAVERYPIGRDLARAWRRARRRQELALVRPGLEWFIGPWLRRTAFVGTAWVAAGALIGIVAGMVVSATLGLMSGDGSLEVATAGVSVVSFWCSVVALIGYAGRELWASFHERRQIWASPDLFSPVKASLVLLLVVALATTMLVLTSTGVLNSVQRAITTNISTDASSPLGPVERVLLSAFGAVFVVAAVRLLRSSADRRYRYSERVTELASAVLATAVAVICCVFPWAPDPTGPFAVGVAIAFGTLTVISFGLLTIGGIIWLAEHLQRYLVLARAKRTLRSYGFSIWALGAWVGAAVIETVLLFTVGQTPIAEVTTPLGVAFMFWAFVWIPLVLFVSFIPGLICTILFMRHTSREYRAWEYESTVAGPGSS